MKYAADKLIYADYNEIIFENLYIGKENESKSLLIPLITAFE